MSRDSTISLFISPSLSRFPVRGISQHLLESSCSILSPYLLYSSNLSRSNPRLLSLDMTTKFQGLPRDPEMVRRTFQKEFEEYFGKNANAKSIYLAAPAQFPRFARLFRVRLIFLGIYRLSIGV